MGSRQAHTEPVIDAHVHFWDPGVLSYPWLAGSATLNRPFGPADHAEAAEGAGIERLVFVEANCHPSENVLEAEWIEQQADRRIAGIVAYAELTDAAGLGRSLDALQDLPRVRGVRHNIQGEPAGFCLQSVFLEGVREAGRRGLTLDVCATHDQLADVVELAHRCDDTRLVLDHCGKPAIRDGLLDPWRARIAELARRPNVWCKLSGLLTEADAAAWREEDLRPFAEHVVDCFGIERLMYGSDWPVVTAAGSYADWLGFVRRFTEGWSAAERRRFYHDNAVRFYRL